MSHWTEKELALTQMDDERLKKRLKKLTQTLSASPERSIPLSCPGWSDTVAAYRFLDNETVSLEKIRSGHRQSTLERIKHADTATKEPRRSRKKVSAGAKKTDG